jgi:DNA topoisomerase I
MVQNLLIVESPSKAKTINKYLGAEYTVLSTVGHIRDLPKSKLGIDIDNDFKQQYVTMTGKKKTIDQLKKAAQEAATIYLATDPDREGEAIAWHVAELFKSYNKPTFRVMFYEITKSGVQRGIKERQQLNMNLVYSQHARRSIDRLVGFKVSPFLWKVLYSGLSAGRVQSVALRLIAERQDEIDAFIPQEYWTIDADVETPEKSSFVASLEKFKDKKLTIENEEQSKEIVSKLNESDFIVASVTQKDGKKNPAPPFITSTLQMAGFSKLRYSTKRTMAIAQQLYEGVSLPNGETAGLITYMRTDSVRVSNQAIEEGREKIKSLYGPQYLPSKARVFAGKKTNVQDAHEAIRPTNPLLSPSDVKSTLTPEQFKLYDLIWSRFIASQMAQAKVHQTRVDILAGDYGFKTTGSQLIFDGFLRVYQDEAQEKDQTLPMELKAGMVLIRKEIKPDQHFTSPPSSYTESSLVKILDKLGIGRPSTYSSIISVVQARGYVLSEKRKLIPTELGRITNTLLVKHFPDMDNVDFTKLMEDELDKIEDGELSYEAMLKEFWDNLSKWLENTKGSTSDIKKSLQTETDVICEKCSKPMTIKWSRNGRFMACTGYPECKNTKALTSDGKVDEELNQTHEDYGKCDKCDSPLVLKAGRFGKFFACSSYPTCKFTKPFETIMACPKDDCKGRISKRHSKRGRIFYGCSNYPTCDFVSWDEPSPQKCPACDNHYMVKKITKKKGEYTLCPKCKHEIISTENAED